MHQSHTVNPILDLGVDPSLFCGDTIFDLADRQALTQSFGKIMRVISHPDIGSGLEDFASQISGAIETLDKFNGNFAPWESELKVDSFETALRKEYRSIEELSSRLSSLSRLISDTLLEGSLQLSNQESFLATPPCKVTLFDYGKALNFGRGGMSDAALFDMYASSIAEAVQEGETPSSIYSAEYARLLNMYKVELTIKADGTIKEKKEPHNLITNPAVFVGLITCEDLTDTLSQVPILIRKANYQRCGVELNFDTDKIDPAIFSALLPLVRRATGDLSSHTYLFSYLPAENCGSFSLKGLVVKVRSGGKR